MVRWGVQEDLGPCRSKTQKESYTSAKVKEAAHSKGKKWLGSSRRPWSLPLKNPKRKLHKCESLRSSSQQRNEGVLASSVFPRRDSSIPPSSPSTICGTAT